MKGPFPVRRYTQSEITVRGTVIPVVLLSSVCVSVSLVTLKMCVKPGSTALVRAAGESCCFLAFLLLLDLKKHCLPSGSDQQCDLAGSHSVLPAEGVCGCQNRVWCLPPLSAALG